MAMMKEKFVKWYVDCRNRTEEAVKMLTSLRLACDWVNTKTCLIKVLWIFLFICWPRVDNTLSNLALFMDFICGVNILYLAIYGSSTANRGWPNLMQMSSSPLRLEHHASLSKFMWLCKKAGYVCWLKIIMKPRKTICLWHKRNTKETNRTVQYIVIHFKSPGQGIIYFSIVLKQQSILKLLISAVMHQ